MLSLCAFMGRSLIQPHATIGAQGNFLVAKHSKIVFKIFHLPTSDRNGGPCERQTQSQHCESHAVGKFKGQYKETRS